MSASAPLRASCVAVAREADGALTAVAFRGPPGIGKSAMALRMMALGAKLVADDLVTLERDGARLIARPPAQLSGMVEARGLGLIETPPAESAPLALVVDLSEGGPAERLPPFETVTLEGCFVSRLKLRNSSFFASALTVLMRYGRLRDPDAARDLL